jgi:hypothetical protein
VKRLLVLALLALGLTATACSDSTGPGDSIAGTYSLQTLNGVPLPVVIDNSGNPTTELVSEQIVLEADGSYHGVTRYRDTYFGQTPQLVDDPFNGFWTLSGNQIALTDVQFPNDPLYGTITNNRLTLDYVGVTAVYQR